MRILYLGQKPIGEECFNILLKGQNNNYTVVGAVSNRTPNVWWNSNAVYDRCLTEGMVFIDNSKPNEKLILQTIEKCSVDFVVSVGHNWILSEEILKAVSFMAVNLHLAKLPDYKGYYSYNHALLNSEQTYGITLHWMTPKVDQGDYVFVQEFAITQDDTAFSLYNKSVKEGKSLFEKFVGLLQENQQLPKKKMTAGGHFYSKQSMDGLRKINDISDIDEIQKKSRAFFFPPFENAYLEINDKKYYVIPKV